MSMQFAKNLEQQLKKADITLETLCDFIDIDAASFLLVIEKQDVPDNYTLEKIADFFKISPEYFANDYKDFHERENIKIPVIASIPCDMHIQKGRVSEYVELSAYIAEFGSHTAYNINDNSMSPLICKGDIIIIRNQNVACNGEIVLSLTDNKRLEIRKIKQLSEGYVLYSLNQNSNANPVFTAKTESNCNTKIIGRVVKIIKKEGQNEQQS